MKNGLSFLHSIDTFAVHSVESEGNITVNSAVKYIILFASAKQKVQIKPKKQKVYPIISQQQNDKCSLLNV